MAAGSTASLVYSLGVLRSPSLPNAPSIGKGSLLWTLDPIGVTLVDA